MNELERVIYPFLGSLFILVLLSACVPGVSEIIQDVRTEIDIPPLPTPDDLFRVTPISTSFEDVYPEAAQLDTTDFSGSTFTDIASMPRTDTGQFILSPGLYELEAESFCLKAGTYGPSEGDGYLPAPLKGDREIIIYKILSTYASTPHVTQQQAQVLLWAIIARTKLTDMSPDIQATAAALLTREELFELNNGVLGLIPDAAWAELRNQIPPEVRQIYEAERQLRGLLSQANYTYESLEDVAVLAGIAPANDLIREVPRGRWAEHPDGYFVRYFPNGYQHTRIEVFVPEQSPTNSQEDSPSPDIIVFNPSGTVAAPANTSAQRIGTFTPPGGQCEIASPEKVQGSFKKKSDAYGAVVGCVCRSGNLSNNTKNALFGFFSAAQSVTNDFDTAEGSLIPPSLSLSRDSLQIMNELSDTLYRQNRIVIETLIENNELLDPSTQRTLTNPVEWIVKQVQFEQGIAERFLTDEGKATPKLVAEMNNLINNIADLPVVGQETVDWVQNQLGEDIDYANEDHRVALGVAAAFDGLGFSEQDFNDFINSGLTNFPQLPDGKVCN